MSDDISFNRAFTPVYGRPEPVVAGVRRLVAANPGPFTFKGTNCYLVGERAVAIIDPGPEDEAQRQAITAAVGSAEVAAIIVTHSHRDHSPLARPLAEAYGVPVYAFGPHLAGHRRGSGGDAVLDAGGDTAFSPDVTFADGDVLTGPDWRLEALHTPGHAADHLCLALGDTGILFSGDHVMGWSTSVVAPPDGNMADYMASLDRLAGRPDSLYLPGHGAPIEEPVRFVRLLAAHRRQREAAILRRVQAGDETIPAMVARIYRGLDDKLVNAAGLSVFAHLEDLIARGHVTSDGEPALDGRFYPA